MRILFTGASSFTGFWFAKELAGRGHEVVAPLRGNLENYRGIRRDRVEALLNFCTVHYSAPFGSEAFLDIIEGASSYDLLCHHAARVQNYRNPDFDVGQAVYDNTYNLLSTLQSLKEKKSNKLVITGSLFEPGEGEGSDGLPPMSPYGLSKGLSSQIYRYYAQTLNLSLGKFVIPNPFGAFEEDRFTSYLARSWIEGLSPVVRTPEYVRDNVPVTLLAKAYASFVESLPADPGYVSLNPSYYVSTQGDFTSLFANHLKTRLNSPCDFQLSSQNIFNEPKIRVNYDKMDPKQLGWDENQFWDELADFYLYQPLVKMSPSIGVIFITHYSRHHLEHSLPHFLNSPLKPRVLVVNSSSGDETVELAQQMGAETLLIPRHSFNHGATRELARKHLGTDIVVFMTPDAYPKDDNVLNELIAPLVNNKASLAYARQVPHHGADFFESFPRYFNYPETSHLRSKEDLTLHGSYTFFCSNTCAAYINKALDEIGGFEPSLFGEDTIAAAKLIERGHRIAYVAESVVHHSHRYSLKQEFRRHFDIGISRKKAAGLFAAAGRVEKRGTAYLGAMIKTLLKKNPLQIPYAIAQCGAKFAGYQIGRRSLKAPLWIKQRLSSQDFFWTSEWSRIL